MAFTEERHYDEFMEEFYELMNTIRDYAWGDEKHIPDFIGLDYPEGKPAAEMWMGAHPSAPSRLWVENGGEKGLDELIEFHRSEALGPAVEAKYGALPFLFKLLAAGKSLSIQVHPDKKTAEEGFNREDSRGVPRDAPNRNYRDDNHKPEIIMAITPFTAMIGFREPEEILRDFMPLVSTKKLPSFLDALAQEADNTNIRISPEKSNSPEKSSAENERRRDDVFGNEIGASQGLKNFLKGLLTLHADEKETLIQAALALLGDEGAEGHEISAEWGNTAGELRAASKNLSAAGSAGTFAVSRQFPEQPPSAAANKSEDSSCPWDGLRRKWISRLIRQFPGDIGVLAPLFLNVVEIAPGEALYQPARMLHAYLDGFGLELMANSDNVLRGGLTVKNIDVSELISILDFNPSVPEILPKPSCKEGEIACYSTPAEEFELCLAEVGREGKHVVLEKHKGPAVLLVMEGDIVLSGGGRKLALKQGGSVFIPWSSSELTVEGRGKIALASVPGIGQ